MPPPLLNDTINMQRTPTTGDAVPARIIRLIASELYAEDLKNFALVSHHYIPIVRPFLFHQFGFTVDGDQQLMQCMAFLAEHTDAARCVKIFSLRGHFYFLPLPELSLSSLYTLLHLLPNVRKLQITGFIWRSLRITLPPPICPFLKDLVLVSMLVRGEGDSPLEILNAVHSWDNVCITDIDHFGEPHFLDDTPYNVSFMSVHHDPWGEPCCSLPIYTCKFRGVEGFVAHFMDFTHARMISQVIKGCRRSLRYIKIIMSCTRPCTSLFKVVSSNILTFMPYRW